MTLPFIRSDVAALAAYTPHPGSADEVLPDRMDPLDTNECPYDLPEVLKEKLTWLYQHEIAANRYPDGGHLALKQLLVQYVTESGGLPEGALSPDYISVGSGSDEIIRSLLIATCVGGAGSILVANPTFSMYGILAQTLGVPVLNVDRDDATFQVDLTAAQAAVENAETPVRMVFMVHPNSPTANALTAAELDWLRQLPDNVLVVVDEAYFEFSQQTTAAEVLQRSNWVVMRTFSKAFRLAAHRVGYSLANPTLTTALEKVRLPYNLPSVSQAVARLALENRQDLLSVIPLLMEQRQQLWQALQSDPRLQVWPTDANFLYVRPAVAPEQQAESLEALFQALRSQGTLVRHTGGGLRITVGTPDENQRTRDHLRVALDTVGLSHPA